MALEFWIEPHWRICKNPLIGKISEIWIEPFCGDMQKSPTSQK